VPSESHPISGSGSDSRISAISGAARSVRADELAVGDAVVGVADHELARLPVGGVPVGQAPGLIERAAPDGGNLVRKLHLPVTVTLVIDADGGVRGRGHSPQSATPGATCHALMDELLPAWVETGKCLRSHRRKLRMRALEDGAAAARQISGNSGNSSAPGAPGAEPRTERAPVDPESGPRA